MKRCHTIKILLLVPLVIIVIVSYASAIIQQVGVVPAPFDVTTGVKVIPVVENLDANIEFEYRWFVNGEEDFFEKSNHYPGAQLKRGDLLAVEITPVTSTGQRLQPYTTSAMETGNARPEIAEDMSEELTEKMYSYQVVATDPDDDKLTYKLETAPEGMKVNPGTGLIEWPFDLLPEGVFPVRIVVEDGFGGRVVQEFELIFSQI